MKRCIRRVEVSIIFHGKTDVDTLHAEENDMVLGIDESLDWG